MKKIHILLLFCHIEIYQFIKRLIYEPIGHLNIVNLDINFNSKLLLNSLQINIKPSIINKYIPADSKTKRSFSILVNQDITSALSSKGDKALKLELSLNVDCLSKEFFKKSGFICITFERIGEFDMFISLVIILNPPSYRIFK